jgi:flagellar biosynthesis protein FlhF
LAQGRSVQILSADVFRIAAADQLRSLCSIVGIGCDVVETPSALAHAISEHRSKSLLLIDTPGYGLRDLDQASGLAAILKAGGVDTHLLVPASMKMADLSRTWAAYKSFHPSKLLFTRIDETSSYGPVVNLAVEASLPLSFFSSGQLIPDDLEEATLERLRDLVFGGDAPIEIAPRRLGAAA